MSRSKKTNAGHVGSEKHLPTSLSGIERKAKQDKHHKFENLYRLLNRYTIGDCWPLINKKASCGIDKINAKMYEKSLSDELRKLEEDLISNKYRSAGIRETFIAKANGSKRPLGIPIIKDKLLQTACSKIIEAIYEPKFYGFRFGYRRNMGAKDAVKELSKSLNFGKYSYIVEADIKGYFENINHDMLIKMLEHDIADRRFIELVRKWLKAKIHKENGKVETPQKGTPQGGVISPVLANIYLHYVLDLWFEKVVKKHMKSDSLLIAYADDFVCAFRYKEDAEKFMGALERRFKKFGLELAKEKTKLIRFSRFDKANSDSFDFLGFTFMWGKSRTGKDIIKLRTSKKKFNQSARAIKVWIKENRNCRMQKLIDLLNDKLRGYYNYYGVIGNSKMLIKMENVVKGLLFKWLNRRSQRRSFSKPTFRRLIGEKHQLTPIVLEKPVLWEQISLVL
jgi:RNA-directed DNA polymerase